MFYTFIIGFALKKHGGNNDIRTPVNSSHIENIRLIYGSSIARYTKNTFFLINLLTKFNDLNQNIANVITIIQHILFQRINRVPFV